MWHFPRFFSEEIKFWRKINAVDNHSAGNERKVKLFTIVRTQHVLRLIEMGFQQVFKIFQQLHFFTVKRSYPKVSCITFQHKIANRNTDDLSKLSPNTGTVIKRFR